VQVSLQRLKADIRGARKSISDLPEQQVLRIPSAVPAAHYCLPLRDGKIGKAEIA